MVDPRGDVVRLAGRDFHWLSREGAGVPVLLMSGCGLAMEFWEPLLPLLSERRVVTYDRPGMGGTPWPGRLPTLADEVASLVALIGIIGAPVVLVAHSMASFHAEGLVRTRPDLVSGVVMVDGSVESPVAAPTDAARGLRLARTVAGVARFRPAAQVARLGWRLGTWQQSHHGRRVGFHPRLDEVYLDSDALATATAEAFAYDGQAWDLMSVRAEHPWPDVPTTVLTASGGEGLQWVDLQKDWAAMLRADWRFVEDSGHLMMLDRPGVIAAAIETMLG